MTPNDSLRQTPFAASPLQMPAYDRNIGAAELGSLDRQEILPDNALQSDWPLALAQLLTAGRYRMSIDRTSAKGSLHGASQDLHQL